MSDNVASLVQAVSAASIPTATGVVAYVRWRKKVSSDRDSRSQIAITAAQRAAEAARAEEQETRKQLLAEKDATINRLELMLAQEQRENERLQGLLLNDRGGHG